MLKNTELEKIEILLEDIQLCDVLVMVNTMVSICDLGDEEGDRITKQELKDNTSTHWKKGNLAVLSTYDFDEGYLQFTIYDKKGRFTDDLEIYVEEDTDIYDTFEEYFDLTNYIPVIKKRKGIK